jgi:hypothetical protein
MPNFKEYIDRERHVDITTLSNEDLESLIKQISDKITNMVDETCDRANRLLHIYGMETKMQIIIQEKGKGKPQKLKKSKKTKV